MLRPIRDIQYREALPRVIADLSLIHVSMIFALAISVVYRNAVGTPMASRELVAALSSYYITFAWMMSPMFVLVFLLNGFYTQSRSYMGRYKALVILRGVGTAVLLFASLSLLFLRHEPVGRSVILPFGALAFISLAGARYAKGYLEATFTRSSKESGGLPGAGEKVLVVGGAGYIGSLLVRRLLAEGKRVRVLDSLVYGDAPLRGVLDHPKLELMEGDCRNIRDVVSAMQGVGTIVHLAAIVGDPACEQHKQTALEINFSATRMLIEIAKGHGVARFVFASSCSVYGATDSEVDEKSATVPVSLYGQTKVDSEQVLLDSRTESFHPTILRFATVFGLSPRPRFDLVVNLLSAKAYQEGVITIYNGQQWRPFIHVRDLVEAILLVSSSPIGRVSGEIFNVGDSRLNYTLSQVADKIRAVFPDTRVEHVDNKDRRNYRVCFDKIRSRLSYRCKYDLQDGIQEIRKAFEEGAIEDYTSLHYHNQRFLQAAGSPAHKNVVDALVMAAFSSAPFGETRATAARA